MSENSQRSNSAASNVSDADDDVIHTTRTPNSTPYPESNRDKDDDDNNEEEDDDEEEGDDEEEDDDEDEANLFEIMIETLTGTTFQVLI